MKRINASLRLVCTMVLLLCGVLSAHSQGTFAYTLSPHFTGAPLANGSAICSIATGCPPSTTPPGSQVSWATAAICNGGVAYSGSFSTYDNQQPQLGCIAPSTSTAAYMAFQAAPSAPQYASQTFATPPFWTGSDLTITFAAAATTGNVVWSIQSGCTNAASDLSVVTFGTAANVTTAISGTTNGATYSALVSNFATPGTNGCAIGSLVTYRIFRAASDTMAGDAHLLGVVLTTRRSQ